MSLEDRTDEKIDGIRYSTSPSHPIVRDFSLSMIQCCCRVVGSVIKSELVSRRLKLDDFFKLEHSIKGDSGSLRRMLRSHLLPLQSRVEHR